MKLIDWSLGTPYVCLNGLVSVKQLGLSMVWMTCFGHLLTCGIWESPVCYHKLYCRTSNIHYSSSSYRAHIVNFLSSWQPQTCWCVSLGYSSFNKPKWSLLCTGVGSWHEPHPAYSTPYSPSMTSTSVSGTCPSEVQKLAMLSVLPDLLLGGTISRLSSITLSSIRLGPYHHETNRCTLHSISQ